jgi:hypothetical protein
LEQDRVFLLRQGEEPRGIIAAGWATGPSFEDAHWNDDSDGNAWYAPIRFDRVLNPATDPLLPSTAFRSGPLSRVRWNTQASGIEVPPDAAALLEEEWNCHLVRIDGTRPAQLDARCAPLVFFRVAWMDRYQGFAGGDTMTGGGAYVAENGFGHEMFNFRPFRGSLYGYVQPPGRRDRWDEARINLTRLGVEAGIDSL